MRIAFICSSLEPGKDGVGDYTRRLAGELIRQGHPSVVIGLNDMKISEIMSGSQEMEGTAIPVLRLPSTMAWKERVTAARKWLGDFNPDWVSLQFVPFGFHPKGLPFGLPRHLKCIIGSRPLHLMFHELWVLWSFSLSLRKRLLGQGQKLCLRSSLRQLKPKVIATQLPFYQAELKKNGIIADVVPLHGNIPVYSKDEANQWLSDRCKKLASRKWVKAGFFGNILPTLNPSLFAARVAELKVKGNELMFLSAGKIGEESLKLWDVLVREHRASVTFFKLGELSERESSLYFSVLDYGITSYPPELMGKSGSVAAMREHGLPVMVCGRQLKNSVAPAQNGCLTVKVDQPWTVTQSANFLLRQFQTDIP